MANCIETKNLTVSFKKQPLIDDISLEVGEGTIHVLIGPTHSGKDIVLQVLCRLIERNRNTVITGDVFLNGIDIFQLPAEYLRRNVGYIQSRPTPFPLSIYDNVAIGLKIQKFQSGVILDDLVEKALRQVGLWNQVRDSLHSDPRTLSEGDQQLLCIARALIVEPQVLLLDNPTGYIDPIGTARIEELMFQLKEEEKKTIIWTVSNIQQAARVSDNTSFLLNGSLIETGKTEEIFYHPRNALTESYITGRFV